MGTSDAPVLVSVVLCQLHLLGTSAELRVLWNLLVAKEIQQCISAAAFGASDRHLYKPSPVMHIQGHFPHFLIYLIDLFKLSKRGNSSVTQKTNPGRRQNSGEAWLWVTKAMWPLLKSVLAAASPFRVQNGQQQKPGKTRRGEVSEAHKIISRVAVVLGGSCTSWRWMVGSFPHKC